MNSISWSMPTENKPVPELTAPPDRLRLRDPAVMALLALVLVLEAASWQVQHGFPIADAVEFMDRAQTFVHGDPLGDDRTIRGFAFSFVFVPLFGLAKLFDLHDLRPLLFCARAMQMGFGLVLVFACARLGALLGGRRAGLAAGFVVGTNPFFLIYSVWPISGVAAAACVALGLERVIEPGRFRRSFSGGVWLGLGFLFAYQTLLIILSIAALLIVFWIAARVAEREDFRRPATLGGVGAGLLAAISIQIVLDRMVYGEWGASLWRYAVVNFLPPLTNWALKLGLTDIARAFYQFQSDLLGFGFDRASEELTTRSKMPPTWYFENIHHMLALPVLVLVLLGAVRTMREKSWKGWLLILAFVINVIVMSTKGWKSFRLWLPLLPMIAPLAGWGFAWFAGVRGERRVLLRRVVLALCLPLIVLLSFREIERQRPRLHGAYWDAIDWINAELEAHPRRDGYRVKLAAAYRWAVFLRTSGAVEPIWLTPLEIYSKLPEGGKRHVKKLLDGIDVLLVHLPVLSEQPELFVEINQRFCVRAAFYDQREHAGLGPVFVLERRPMDAGGRRFYEFSQSDDPESYRRRHHLGRPVRFVTGDGDEQQSLTLLGFECEMLPGSDHLWLTYHWHADTDLSSDLRVIDRLTEEYSARSAHNNHFPAYGVRPTSQWKRGTVLRESYLVVPSENAYFVNRPFQPIGGAFRRGDLIPARLWVAVIDGDEQIAAAPPLEVRDTQTGEAPRAGVTPGTLWNIRGWRFTTAGLVEVGGFFMPVPRWAAAEDNGKPLPN